MCCWTVTYLRKINVTYGFGDIKVNMPTASCAVDCNLRIFMLPNCSSCPTLMQCTRVDLD